MFFNPPPSFNPSPSLTAKCFGFLFVFSFCLNVKPLKGLRLQAEAVEILVRRGKEGC